jgi:REP element-mobilizing transposase RayT
MQKTIPLEAGKYYHIYNRGNNGQNIFIEERNYAYFLNLYAKYIEPIAATFAYCLLRNHFHLGVRIKENLGSESPSQHFSNFFNAYSKAINRAYGHTGSLFENRYRRREVMTDAYFQRLIHYIHWNPQKHGFVADFRDYPYSSYSLFLMDKPTFIKRVEVLNWWAGRDGFIRQHQEFVAEKELQDILIEEAE